MDIRFELYGTTFIWNAEKARRNERKHDDIRFEQATEAFFDPFLRLVDANRKDEVRDAIIGFDT